jgi:hypothetical protein
MTGALPEEFQGALPSVEELEAELGGEDAPEEILDG